MIAIPRLVLDTNIIVSASLWGGEPLKLLEMVGDGDIRLYSSRVLLTELTEVLARPKLAKPLALTGFDAKTIASHYRRLVTLVMPAKIKAVSRDPDDDHVLACALAAKADIIVSGDADLLVLKNHQGTAILKVADALRLLTA